jgi:hypothetical protein
MKVPEKIPTEITKDSMGHVISYKLSPEAKKINEIISYLQERYETPPRLLKTKGVGRGVPDDFAVSKPIDTPEELEKAVKENHDYFMKHQNGNL